MQLQHQQGERQEQHHRHTGHDGRRAFGAFFYRARHFNTVAVDALGGPLRFQLFHLGLQFGGHSGTLQAFDHIALHGDGVVAVFTPHHAGLPGEYRFGDLGNRDRLATARRQIRIGNIGDGVALVQRLSQHNVYQLVAFAVLPDRGARGQGFGRLRNALAANAQGACFVLIHLQAEHLDRLIPVVVHTAGIAALAHDGLYFVCAVAQNQRIRTHHAELHRIGHRWPVRQELDAAPHLGKLCCQQGRELHAQRLTHLQVHRHDDELRHVGLREHLVQWQVEPGHAGPDPGAHCRHAGLLHQTGFHPLGHSLVVSKGGSFREPDIHQDLRSTRIREELLLHLAHAHNTECEHENRPAYRHPAVLHTPVHRAAEGVVERRVKVLLVCRFATVVVVALEQQGPQIGHKVHRHKPAQNQGQHCHRKNGVGVLAGH